MCKTSIIYRAPTHEWRTRHQTTLVAANRPEIPRASHGASQAGIATRVQNQKPVAKNRHRDGARIATEKRHLSMAKNRHYATAEETTTKSLSRGVGGRGGGSGVPRHTPPGRRPGALDGEMPDHPIRVTPRSNHHDGHSFANRDSRSAAASNTDRWPCGKRGKLLPGLAPLNGARPPPLRPKKPFSRDPP